MNSTNVKSLVFALLPAAGFVQAQQKPNIVVILADDLASNEISCYGGKNLITPNIDRIAKEGVRFTNNFASCTMSVPIRASLYTGLYPARHGSYQNHKASNPDIKSVTHYFPEAGYRVGRAGKTHTAPRKVYNFEKIPGFEENCVSNTANYTVGGIREFIQRDNNPFCLFVCSIHPHAPWTWGNQDEFDADKVILPPNCVDNQETRKLFRKYLAEIRALDDEVGAVLKVLEESGKLDNTLVIFLGEQGPQLPGGKWTCWNFGQNSALAARYPAKIKAKSTSHAIVQYEDILPTLIEVAGGDEIAGIDGKSFLKALYGKAKKLVDRYVRRPAIEFYDMEKDPWELNNLAEEKKYAERISRMKAELQKWMLQQGDTGADMDIKQEKYAL
ncbi:MAG: sulfatase [Bacteroidales bacterium]